MYTIFAVTELVLMVGYYYQTCNYGNGKLLTSENVIFVFLSCYDEMESNEEMERFENMLKVPIFYNY